MGSEAWLVVKCKKRSRHVIISWMVFLKNVLILLALSLTGPLSACSQTTQESGLASTPPASPTLTGTKTPTSLPTRTPLPQVDRAAVPTATNLPSPFPTPHRCSPLAGYLLAELPGIVSNPYNPPEPPSDDPHHGVDLAELLPGSQVAVPGMAVQAAFDGRVAGVINDRFPYGYAVIVETPLESLGSIWPSHLVLPTPLPSPLTSPVLTCPAVEAPYERAEPRSLYILYAHLQSAPPVQPGQALACGDMLGALGDSGNALAPHLHFETRLGPGGAHFASLANYDNSATQQEMGLYCLWRVSGIFQLLDPLALLGLQP